jgi:hypothetical protein
MRGLTILLLCFATVGCAEALGIASDLIEAEIEDALEEEEEEEKEPQPPTQYDFRVEDRTAEIIPDLARLLGWLFVTDEGDEPLGLRVDRQGGFVEFEAPPEFPLRGTMAGDTVAFTVAGAIDGVLRIDRIDERLWDLTGRVRVVSGTCDLRLSFDEPFTVLFPEPRGVIVGTIAGMAWSGRIEVEGTIGGDDASFRLDFDGTGGVRGSALRVAGESQEDFEAQVAVSSEAIANLRPCLESYETCSSEVTVAGGLLHVTVQQGLDRIGMTVATDGAGGLLTDWVLLEGIPFPGSLIFLP